MTHRRPGLGMFEFQARHKERALTLRVDDKRDGAFRTVKAKSVK